MRYLDLPTRKRYSVIGLGTWQFGSREWGYGREYDEHAAGEIVARARALGITVFDTAEIYGFGRSERILGQALRESGGTDDVVVATKVFPVLPTAPVVQQRGVASAHRLGVRTIDLYQVHQPHPVVGDATTMRGMRALRDVGLVDEVGVSNYPLSPLAARRGRAGRAGAVQPGAVQPGRARPDGRPAAVGAAHRARRDGLQPAGARACCRAATPPRTARPAASARPTRCSCPRTSTRPRRCWRCCARSAAAHGATAAQIGAGLARAPPERRGDPRGVERRAGGEQRRRGRRSRSPPTSTRADAPRPRRSARRTGVSAIPGLVRARRLTRRARRV